MKKVILKKNEERRIKNGHLWIFSNELQSVDNGIESGDIVEVYDHRQNFLGSGFYNAHSLISVRMITNEKDFEITKLLEDRLLSAYNYRKIIYPNRESFRMVFSESDFLPGLIIDKYNNTFVLQIYSVGIEKNVDVIVNVLKEKFHAENIFTKHDEYFRKLEGLDEENNTYLGTVQIEVIDDGKIKYEINFGKGQKTGFFFDQCDNRYYFGKFCENKSVLDCFCNSGGFGLHAVDGGAKSVTFVDSSKTEIENTKKNFELNRFICGNEFVDADVFDYLQKCIINNKKYDVVNIDPPAFAKSRKNLPTAIKGYTKLNKLAMEVVRENGLLFTSSCSHHVNREMFLDMINSAAVKSNKKIQLIYFNNASLDHPVLPQMEETIYLKFAVVRVIK